MSKQNLFANTGFIVYKTKSGNFKWSPLSAALPEDAAGGLLVYAQDDNGRVLGYLNGTEQSDPVAITDGSTADALWKLVAEASQQTEGKVMAGLRDKLIAQIGTDPTINEVKIEGRRLVVVIDRSKGFPKAMPHNFDVQILHQSLDFDPSLMNE